MYDVVIIGGGVAGLTAGLYLSRANKKCVILEGRFLGGQTALLNTVANYTCNSTYRKTIFLHMFPQNCF